MSEFTHLNEHGYARMVDISAKAATVRTAEAYSQVKMKPEVWRKVKEGGMKKGDVLAVAQIAGIMAAKKTAEWIPMCHPILLSGTDIAFDMREEGLIAIQAEVKTVGATGVEMEALTAASAAALTIYDMCKSMDRAMEIGPSYVLDKQGGKSGHYHRESGEG